jgi:hypothetical protein
VLRSSVTNAEHTAALARVLVDPARLRAMLRRRAPEATRLAFFAGLVTKVQHNFLWENFPGVTTILRRAGVELDLFRNYFLSRRSPRRQSATGQSQKVDEVVQFIDAFLRDRRNNPSLRGARDVLRHERSIWEVRLSQFGWLSGHGHPPGVARLLGPMRVVGFRFNPTEVLRATACAPWTGHRIYFALGGADTAVRVFDIDPAAALMARRLTRCEPLQAILRAAVARSMPRATAVAVLIDFERKGLIRLPRMGG